MELLKAGKIAEAEQAFLRVLASDKQSVHARFALGIACYQLGRLEDAARYLTETIALSPQFLPAYNNLGLVYKTMGFPDRGMATLRRALQIHPGYVDAIYNLALMLEEAGEYEAAIASYGRVIELNPIFMPAHANLGLLLRASGDFPSAHRHLSLVATRAPEDASGAMNLALVLTDLAHYTEAIAAGARAVQLDPENCGAWEALGNAQRLGGDASGAVASLRRALALQPTSDELQYELGLAQLAAGEFDSGRATLGNVARLRPEWLKVRFAHDLTLPIFYQSEQQIADANEEFSRAIDVIDARLADNTLWSVPEAVAAVSGYAPFYLHYQGLDNTRLQKRFGTIVGRIAERSWPQFSDPVNWKPRDHGDRLRVGFVSAYLRHHSVGHFFGNWICLLDRQIFETFVWYAGESSDSLSEKIRANASHFRHAAFDTSILAEEIRASRLDILIYLDVGMHPHSQLLAALRLAPIQCATFGHPVTTGIKNIGYFLSTEAGEPEHAQQHYSEKLVRLPRFAVCYDRPDVTRKSSPSNIASLHRPLLVCAQPMFKILPHMDRLVARIVQELPGCQLAFFQSLWPQVNDAFVARIGRALRQVGADPGKTLKLLPIMPHHEYLGTLAAADVVLDTPGFSGGHSSFDTIAIGAPVVTFRGPMLRGRQTAAMLDIVGLHEFASETDDAYVNNVIRLASDRTLQAQVRAQLMSGGAALFDDVGTIRGLENALTRLSETPHEHEPKALG
jgi:predicted O-linked N-acetylglucosamine transferase (SPINDLY family)